MAKVAEDAAEELPLNDERIEAAPKKLNRHVVIALNHMHKRRDTLTDQIDRLVEERKDLLEAIEALG